MPKRIAGTIESANKSAKLGQPESKDAFLEVATPVAFTVGEVLSVDVPPTIFSTGSCGWGYSGKLLMPCGSLQLPVQCNLNVTLNGSKEWPGESVHEKLPSNTATLEAVQYQKSKFIKEARTFPVCVGPLTATLKPKSFSSGSVGWFASTRGLVSFGEYAGMCMVSLNATVLKSKEWDSEGEESYDGEESEETDDPEASPGSEEETDTET
ncbi:MAG: uncharacterized protein KVP18_001113 [Porospora cf. gigantea A]|uniref:uncharacterized protein n=2 Tax=Porospora cf. gigantea A TaxID=2853593 RepID=UPI003559AA5F|nr:MAG: hypothetical protein KVP18_001113 [Porospora cf. gigantea A]